MAVVVVRVSFELAMFLVAALVVEVVIGGVWEGEAIVMWKLEEGKGQV